MQTVKEFIEDCEKSFAAAQEYGDEITNGPNVLIDDVIYVPITEIGGLLRRLADITSEK